jgi:hypothetical protein
MTNWREKARYIFEMVYQWGKVGVIVDDSAHAYQDSIKELIREAQAEAWDKCDDEWRDLVDWEESDPDPIKNPYLT